METLTLSKPETQIVDRDDLIQRAYNSVGYRPSKDFDVVRDRMTALGKLSNDELRQLINKNQKGQ